MKDVLPKIEMRDYSYNLPEERIAKYPLPQRDASKLLVWAGHSIEHRRFSDLPQLFSGEELLFFNNTKVIPARLFFQKATRAVIEIFLLSPQSPALVDIAMGTTATCTWQCTVGNLKSWKNEQVLERTLKIGTETIVLKAALLDRAQMLVKLSWSGGFALPAVLEAAGQTPIPPYLRRAAEASDRSTYQTVYGKKEGAVAAPTAGLHFTPAVLDALHERGVRQYELTLHVSAGTFMPVKVENAIEHDMHFEQVVVERAQVAALCTKQPVVAVGTTSMRTLESMYWYGVKLQLEPETPFVIEKTDAYTLSQQPLPDLPTAMQAILDRMERTDSDILHGTTQLYIMPGYQFRVVDALITNFHQPGSTLLLLVAAFTGGNAWRTIYAEALQADYRFLSYGDSSFLRRSTTAI